MRGTLVSLLCLLAISPLSAFEVHSEQHNTRQATCQVAGDFDVDLALHNSTLYQQVHTWMHDKDVQDWTYAAANKSNETELIPCALVSYKTLVASPTFFARFLRNFHMSVQFPIAVQKQVCQHGSTVIETATVSAPLIHELTMTVRYDVRGGHIDSVLDAHYTLPWYIDFLVNDVSQHLSSNFKEKLDAVAESLCSYTTTFASLSAPQHAYLRQKTHAPPNDAPPNDAAPDDAAPDSPHHIRPPNHHKHGPKHGGHKHVPHPDPDTTPSIETDP
jgi:hypothetical protein